MQIPDYMVFLAIEACVILMLISVLLSWHTYRQRQLIRRQQEKLRAVILELRQLRSPPMPETSGTSYKTYLHAQQIATRNRFAGIVPDTDIHKALTADLPPEHKALALRQRLLQLEEAATERGDGPLQIDWVHLETGLARLLDDLTATSPSLRDELAMCRKRIGNLEKFKQLFFELEPQWQKAQQQAQVFYGQLSGMAQSVENNGQLLEILDNYHNLYRDIYRDFTDSSHHLEELTGDKDGSEIGGIPLIPADSRTDEEIIRLRNVAADQHQIISQLQRKLDDTVSIEAKDVVINELQQQFQRQIRFMRESETCIKLLEDELTRTNEKLQHTTKALKALEKENAVLKGESGQATLEDHTEALKDIKAQYLALQQEYVNLEEKYLTSKHKS